MSIIKRLVAGVLLTLLLAANLAQLQAYTPAVHDAYVSARLYPMGIIQFKKKHYDEMGRFLGCWGYGSDCLTIPLEVTEVTLSSAGIHTQ